MVYFYGETANDDAKTLIQETKVGGIIYYKWANGLTSPEQVRSLSLGLQTLTQNNRVPIPLLTAADQEGGRVQRLKEGFIGFPSNRDVARKNDPDRAALVAEAIGKELQSAGINMNFAPVIDVDSNPKNPVIGSRSFSIDPKVVALFGEKALEGMKASVLLRRWSTFPDTEMLKLILMKICLF